MEPDARPGDLDPSPPHQQCVEARVEADQGRQCESHGRQAASHQRGRPDQAGEGAEPVPPAEVQGATGRRPGGQSTT